MAQDKILEMFESGVIISPSIAVDAGKLPWIEHPAFKGVFLKDLVTAADTDGTFSCHLVKVDRGAAVGKHAHDKEWEFNEVLAGSGIIVLDDKEYPCMAGVSCINPPGVPHIVSAPEDDLYLLAKFIPALK